MRAASSFVFRFPFFNFIYLYIYFYFYFCDFFFFRRGFFSFFFFVCCSLARTSYLFSARPLLKLELLRVNALIYVCSAAFVLLRSIHTRTQVRKKEYIYIYISEWSGVLCSIVFFFFLCTLQLANYLFFVFFCFYSPFLSLWCLECELFLDVGLSTCIPVLLSLSFSVVPFFLFLFFFKLSTLTSFWSPFQ